MKNIYPQPKMLALVAGLFFFTSITIAQNVGINTTTPAERLDVNGNINVTGTIKANGVDGSANQVLMKDGAGTMMWGDMCEYKNIVMLTNPSGTWIVPAGVAKIVVEVWGAGGGGNTFGGGAGGSYISAAFAVTPGLVVTYTTGTGGGGAGLAAASNGGISTAQIGSPAVSISGNGGGGAGFATLTTGSCGSPGGIGASGVLNYYYEPGKGGEAASKNYMQYNATTFYETGMAGKGGDAGNKPGTGGVGGYYIFNTTGNTLVFRAGKAATGYFPGGGGAGGYDYNLASVSGGNGANGLVLVRW
jgi:hypothetical protein